MNELFRRRFRKTSGQTLLLGIIILVILLVAILVFFDIQNAVRGKVKGQNAADAAALTGAVWQKNSLNLIGELNLIKATTLLISDESLGIAMLSEDFTRVPDEASLPSKELVIAQIQRVEQEKNLMRTALALLDEMQVRISFVGPLIGFGAAQQAAKNNGINANTDVGEIFRNSMYKNVWDDTLYGNELLASQEIHGYKWLTPYRNMIGAVLGTEGGKTYGIAATSCFDFLGAPYMTQDPPGPLSDVLQSRSFYDAVMGNNWCALMDFLDNVESADFEKDWWKGLDIERVDTFTGESEILSLHVKVSDGGTDIQTTAGEPALSCLTQIIQRRSDGRQDLNTVFDMEDPYAYTVDEITGTIQLQLNPDGTPWRNPKDTDSRFKLIPINWAQFEDDWSRYPSDMANEWSRYLDDSFKPGMDYYSGALSYFEITQDLSTYTGKHKAPAAFHSNMTVTTRDHRTVTTNIGSDDALGSEMKMYAQSAADTSSSMKQLHTPIKASSSAKPVGRIKTSSGCLAPFEAGGLVLPVFTHAAMIPIALEPPSGYDMSDVGWYYFVSEFIPLLGSSESFEDAVREAAAQYPEHYTTYFSYFISALKRMRDPAWRQRGLDWLNNPIAWDEDGNVITRNRDRCNYWPGGQTEGQRHGPGILH